MLQRWVWNVLSVMMVVSAGQAVESQPALAGFQVVDSNQAVLDDALERAATPSQLGSSEQSHEDQEETTASELVRDDGVGYNPGEFDRDLFEAGSRLPLDMSSLRTPWEGSFMIRQIFGMPPPAGWVRKRTLLPEIAGPDRPEAVQKGGKVIHAAVIERTKRLVHESDFELRQRALARWKAILDVNIMASQTGRFLVSCSASMRTDESLGQILSDTLSGKATRTVLKRAADLMKYIKWCRSRLQEPFPFTAETLYQCMSCMREGGAAATALSSLKSAVSFAGSVMGFDGALDSASHKQVASLSSAHYLTKPPRVQKQPFSVQQVLIFEHALMNAASRADRLFAGYVLFCTYGRLRHSDSQRVKSFGLDEDTSGGGGFVECKQLGSKTGTTLEKRTTWLPVAMPMRGVSKSNLWAKSYKELLI